MSTRPKTELGQSTVWAAVVVICALLVFFGFLINAGRTAELRSMLILLGQGAIGIVNLWVVYRGTKAISNKADQNREVTTEIKDVVTNVQSTINGTTPQPGSIPPVGYQPEH